MKLIADLSDSLIVQQFNNQAEHNKHNSNNITLPLLRDEV